MDRSRTRLSLVLPLWALAWSSCAEENRPISFSTAQQENVPDASRIADKATVEGGAPLPQVCLQAHAQPLPARLVAMSGDVHPASVGTVIFVDDLSARFNSVCGSCHGPATSGLGGFQIKNPSEFKSKMGAKELHHVLSDGPTASVDDNPMPPFSSPNGGPYSARQDGDPVKEFAKLVSKWLELGSPASFTEAAPSTSTDSANSYLMNPSTGNAMTNLGNCIPSKALFGIEETKSTADDERFASRQPLPKGPGVSANDRLGLPEHLSETDLFTLDAKVLAQHGVVAFAPAYPLWSDDAGKMRHVRVPRGSSIHFDKEKQRFDIPSNTRFYKTFMKEIADTDGSLRYRKIETRLIVSRPDRVNADGTLTPTALFGTYQWNPEETDATLVTTPQVSGEPFADTMLQYHTDEQLANSILAANPLEPELALIDAHAARHYAIPSSDRCIQCHEGSASQSFILGFLPVQINRVPQGTSGTIEETSPDELTQLQRFIDYGLITGVDSPSDILPLERTQGQRKPRNEQELVAQGYVLGNCSHCHNPHGFPSLQNAVLVNQLDFLPGPTGGIFQFPLERYSPRIFRGPVGTTTIPYITPSLMDQPVHRDAGDLLKPGHFAQTDKKVTYAPWRSLIYRNVDNAFAYSDDFALFPHMPMDTPGYDARAKRILGSWMVSIPSVRKRPELDEYAFCVEASCDPKEPGSTAFVNGLPDESPQPYVEVLPGDPAFAHAQDEAKVRLGIFKSGMNPRHPELLGASPDPGSVSGLSSDAYSRYADPLETSDIVDPRTIADPVCNPVPQGQPPKHPSWVVTDLSQPPGDWSPRRPDWGQALAAQMSDPASSSCTTTPASAKSAQIDEADAASLLQDVSLDHKFRGRTFREFATAPIPFGLWKTKDGCNFGAVPKVGSFVPPPRWIAKFAERQSPLPADAPVYEESPGAAIFKSVCINCHGPLGNADGRLAQNLATMSGGLARVADFRDGLFGPLGASPTTSNRHFKFGIESLPKEASAGWREATDDDRAARYMAWMALGGTKVNIPQSILQIVSLTRVLGVNRPFLPGNAISANMLSMAKIVCETFLGGAGDNVRYSEFDPKKGAYGDLDNNAALIRTNGDANLWLDLCTFGHASPVHALIISDTRCKNGTLALCEPTPFDSDQAFDIEKNQNVIDPLTYPPGLPVGNEAGTLDATLTADNIYPWCVVKPSANDAAGMAFFTARNLPACPDNPTYWKNPSGSRWATRGAINAGLAVYLYLDGLEKKQGPDPDYDQCELLAKP